MKKNPLFEKCLSNVAPEVREEVRLNMDIANRIYDILQARNMTQREFAALMGKRESEISRWLTGSHGFTTATLAKISTVLGDPIVQIKHEPETMEKTKEILLSPLAKKYYDILKVNRTTPLFKKGMWICKDNPIGNVLVAGMNPSGEEKGECIIRESTFIECLNSNNKYWQALKTTMPENMISKVAYLDIFPFHEGKQLIAEGLLSIELTKRLLKITHEEIERINPQLLIIANKRSAAYWGLYKWSWMDYDFGDRIPDSELPFKVQGLGLEVYQIRGYKGKEDRIVSTDKTNLEGTIVINYGYHNSPYQSEKKNRWTIPHTIGPEAFATLFDYAKKRKDDWAGRVI